MNPEQNQPPQEPRSPFAVPPAAPARKKSVAPLIVILSIIALAGVGFGVYGLFFRGVSEPEPECTTECVKEESTIKLSEVRSLVDKFIVMDPVVAGLDTFKDAFADEYKYYIAMHLLGYETVELNDGSNGYCSEYDITYDELNNVYHENFGSDSDVIKTADFCGTPYYSEELKKYVGGCGCGGASDTTYDYEILDYDMLDGSLVVTVAYLEMREANNYDGKYYLKLANGEEEEVNSFNIERNYNGPGNSLRYEYINTVPKFALTFEKEDGHYIFTNIEKLQK